MALTDHVRITVRRVRSALSRAGFGTLMSLGAHRLWEDRYTKFGSLKELQDAGTGSTDAEERVATAYFGQSPAPRFLGIGRRATGDTVTVSVPTVLSSVTYKLKVGGLLHAVTSPPSSTAALIVAALVRQVFGGFEITAVTPASKLFKVFGDHVTKFPVNSKIVVLASTGNNGTYTVVSATLNAGSTDVVVSETVPSATADGHIDGYAIIGVSITNETFTLSGDVRSRFPAGLKFHVLGSTGNDSPAGTPWVVSSTALDGSGNTVVTVTGNVTSSVADGGIVSAADGAAATGSVTAAVVGSNMDLTPTVASAFYTVALAGESKLRLAFTAPDTVATDLAAVETVSTDWYGLMLTTRLLADVKAMAAAVETRRKIAGTATSDAVVASAAPANDDPITGTIAAQLKGLAYSRTWGMFSRSNSVGTGVLDNADDKFPEAGAFGRRFPTEPGRANWNLFTIVGMVPDTLTSTERSNILGDGGVTSFGKNWNVYEYVNPAKTVSGFGPGVVSEPEWIDTIVGLDWFHARLEERVFNVLKAAADADTKIPYTQKGANVFAAEMRAQFEEGIAQTLIARDPAPEVAVPDVSTVSTGDKDARLLRNILGRGTLAGAIQQVELAVEVSV